MDINHGTVPRQGVNSQRRAQRRSTNADVDEMTHLAQNAAVNRLHKAAHAGMQGKGFLNSSIAAQPALGGMLGGAILGYVDGRPAQQLCPGAGKIHCLGQSNKAFDMGSVEMGFRPVEADATPAGLLGQIQPLRQQRQPRRIGGKKFGQTGARQALEPIPHRACHIILAHARYSRQQQLIALARRPYGAQAQRWCMPCPTPSAKCAMQQFLPFGYTVRMNRVVRRGPPPPQFCFPPKCRLAKSDFTV